MIKHHRGYDIESKNGRHVARSTDGDDIAIHSIYLPRVLDAIDLFWTVLNNIRLFRNLDRSAIDRMPAPRWLREWLANPTHQIDLDSAYARGAC